MGKSGMVRKELTGMSKKLGRGGTHDCNKRGKRVGGREKECTKPHKKNEKTCRKEGGGRGDY